MRRFREAERNRQHVMQQDTQIASRLRIRSDAQRRVQEAKRRSIAARKRSKQALQRSVQGSPAAVFCRHLGEFLRLGKVQSCESAINVWRAKSVGVVRLQSRCQARRFARAKGEKPPTEEDALDAPWRNACVHRADKLTVMPPLLLAHL